VLCSGKRDDVGASFFSMPTGTSTDMKLSLSECLSVDGWVVEYDGSWLITWNEDVDVIFLLESPKGSCLRPVIARTIACRSL
jgi:hypothetical protein